LILLAVKYNKELQINPSASTEISEDIPDSYNLFAN